MIVEFPNIECCDGKNGRVLETTGSKKIKSNQKPSLNRELPTNFFVATSANRIKWFLNVMIEEAVHRGPIFSE